MRKISLAFGSLLVVSTLMAAPCLAEQAAGPAAPKHAAKKAEKKTATYVGEVLEIDHKTNRMVVAPKNSEIAMVLNTSRVKKVSGYSGVQEVKAGDWVEADYEAKVGTMYALTLTKSRKPEESKKSGAKREKPANHP